MFGEMSLLAWMGSAIVFAIGGGAGFFIARQIKDKRTLELEQQLQDTKNKLTQYQADVNTHFLKTSLLFNKLTDNYKEVYEHLATGAQKLCNDKPLTRALDLPETKILSAAVATEESSSVNTSPETADHETAQPQTGAAEDTHNEDIEHIGVESATITDEISTAQQDTTPGENTAATQTDEKQGPVEQSAEEPSNTEVSMAEPSASEKPANTVAAGEAPQISDEELKTLEADEKKKAEEEEVHLGAESTPGVELEHHKTHPRIH